jgi:hypothetical protein
MSRILGFGQDSRAEGIKMNMKMDQQGGGASCERTPRFAKEFNLPTCAGSAFNLKKDHFLIISCYLLTKERRSTQIPSIPTKKFGTGNGQVYQGRCGFP